MRIYTDNASRSADSSRAQGSAPAEGTGVVAEFVATAATTFKVSPAVFGWVDSQSTVPVAVTNNSSSTRTITVTLTALTLETV